MQGDALAAELTLVLAELERAEDAAARAGHALAEAEELAEEDAAAREKVGTCRAGFEAAATRLAEVRERRRQLERKIGEREALRVHDARCR